LQLALDAPDVVNTVAVLEPFIPSVIMAAQPVAYFDPAFAIIPPNFGDRAGAVEVSRWRSPVMASLRRSIERCRRGTSSGGSKPPTRCSKTTALA